MRVTRSFFFFIFVLFFGVLPQLFASITAHSTYEMRAGNCRRQLIQASHAVGKKLQDLDQNELEKLISVLEEQRKVEPRESSRQLLHRSFKDHQELWIYYNGEKISAHQLYYYLGRQLLLNDPEFAAAIPNEISKEPRASGLPFHTRVFTVDYYMGPSTNRVRVEYGYQDNFAYQVERYFTRKIKEARYADLGIPNHAELSTPLSWEVNGFRTRHGSDLFQEIVERQFQKNVQNVEIQQIVKSTYKLSDGRVVGGLELLRQMRLWMFLAEGKGNPHFEWIFSALRNEEARLKRYLTYEECRALLKKTLEIKQVEFDALPKGRGMYINGFQRERSRSDLEIVADSLKTILHLEDSTLINNFEHTFFNLLRESYDVFIQNGGSDNRLSFRGQNLVFNYDGEAENAIRIVIQAVPGAADFETFQRLNISIGGQDCSGANILTAYAKYINKEKSRKNPKAEKITPKEAFQKYCAENGLQSIESMDEGSFLALVARSDIHEIFQNFGDDPEALSLALRSLGNAELLTLRIDQIVERFTDLRVKGRVLVARGRDKVSPKERRKEFLALFFSHLSHSYNKDHLKAQFDEQLYLLKKLFRGTFQDNIEAAKAEIKELRRKIKEATYFSEDAAKHLEKLYAALIKDLSKDEKLELPHHIIDPLPYQREGISFLAEKPRAILADEAGLGKTYQAFAAAEVAGAKKVIWLTNATNRGQVVVELAKFSKNTASTVDVATSTDVNNAGKYYIMSYEMLATLHSEKPELYQKLIDGCDTMIADEAQLAENMLTLRAQAMRQFQPQRLWLLTATPYRSKVDGLFDTMNLLFPNEFTSRPFFQQRYTQDAAGLAKLHARLRGIVLRREKNEVAKEFDASEGAQPLHRQLEDGPRIAKQVRIDPTESGYYHLAPEQEAVLTEMLFDFDAWANKHNASPAGQVEAVKGRSALEKFRWLWKLYYEPHVLGLKIENPIYKMADQVVQRRVGEKNEKIILWAWNVSVASELQSRYSKHGVLRVDDENSANRQEILSRFETDPDSHILILNYKSGCVGLNIAAADASVFVQIPENYTTFYQAGARNHRIIDTSRAHLAKARVEIETLIPQYSSAFVAGIGDADKAAWLSKGTLIEQLYRRTVGQEVIYNLVMNGVGDPRALEAELKRVILSSLWKDSSQTTPKIKLNRLQRSMSFAEASASIWERLNNSQRESFVEIAENMASYPKLSGDFANIINRFPDHFISDLPLFEDICRIPNKALREQTLEHFVVSADTQYESGLAFSPSQSALKQHPTVAAIVGSIATDHPLVNDLKNNFEAQEQILLAYFDLGPEFSSYVAQNLTAHDLYRVAKLHALDVKHVDIENIADAEVAYIESACGVARSEWSHDFDEPARSVLLSLAKSYRNASPKIQSEWKEVAAQRVRGKSNFKNWRNSVVDRIGYVIRAFSDKFWKIFAKDQVKVVAVAPRNNPKIASWIDAFLYRIRSKSAESLITKIDNENVAKAVMTFVPMEAEALEAARIPIADQVQAMRAEIASSQKIAPDRLEEKRSLEAKLAWLDLLLAAKGKFDPEKIKDVLSRREKAFLRKDRDDLAIEMAHIRSMLPVKNSLRKEVKIEETSDPDVLLRLGALAPRMRNCFNPDGDAKYNQYALGVAASRNTKVLIVRDVQSGAVLSAAMLKVRVDASNTIPVLFLERPLHMGESFETEMLSYLQERSKEIKQESEGNLWLARTIIGKIAENDPKIWGTGAYTDVEYVEALWGIRDQSRIEHRARLVPLEVAP